MLDIPGLGRSYVEFPSVVAVRMPNILRECTQVVVRSYSSQDLVQILAYESALKIRHI